MIYIYGFKCKKFVKVEGNQIALLNILHCWTLENSSN